jgi:hypothetical protein
VREVLNHPYFIGREHHLCGDELSVCGRFVQNALGPVMAVAFANGNRIRFGDFKVCAEAVKATKNEKMEKTGRKDETTYIPDFVGVRCDALNILQLKEAIEPTMVLVGEAKAPWRHDLESHFTEWQSRKSQRKLRNALGMFTISTFLARESFTKFSQAKLPHTCTIFRWHMVSLQHMIPLSSFANAFQKENQRRNCTSLGRFHGAPPQIPRDFRRANAFTTSYTSPRIRITSKLRTHSLWKKWVDKKSDKAAWENHGPRTPQKQPGTPREVVHSMSPAVSRVISPSEPIKLYQSLNGGLLVGFITFKRIDVEDNYVVIDGKKIRVEIVVDNDDSINANDDFDDFDDDDHDDDSDDDSEHEHETRIPELHAQSSRLGASFPKKPSRLIVPGLAGTPTPMHRSSGAVHRSRGDALPQSKYTQMVFPHRPATAKGIGGAPDMERAERPLDKGKERATEQENEEDKEDEPGKQSQYYPKKGKKETPTRFKETLMPVLFLFSLSVHAEISSVPSVCV